MTTGNIGFLFCCVVIAIGITIWADFESSETGIPIITGLVCFMIILILGGGIFWYNHATANGTRALKEEYKSEIDDGLEREITITTEDGRKIFHYKGKVNIESDHEDNYILFKDEEGKRQIVYYGVQDTVIISEK